MEKKQKGYIILEVGYEYNDEYYHTGSYGETYEAPNKVFLSKEKAEAELRIKTLEKLRGEDLGRYNGDGIDGISKKGMQDELAEILKKEFNIDAEEYEMEIPSDATDEQLDKVLECLDLNFFELIEIEVE